VTVPTHVADTPRPRQPGRLSRALTRLWMKHARVVEVEHVAEGFRLITLESPEFKSVQWIPGQKVQIAMQSAFVARTFTPIEWDAATGRTRILAYAHGVGPGSAWICGIKPDDECDVFGPRASLDVSHAVADTRVVFGDETSIGLAYALSRHSPGGHAACLLEVNSLPHAGNVITRLKLDRADLFERTQSDTHLAEIERRIPALATAGATFVLTGKASSIQHLRRLLKALDVPTSRLQTKAYWAPGKTGLD
jgi:NADPH-dependent ferric siderophore reductase